MKPATVAVSSLHTAFKPREELHHGLQRGPVAFGERSRHVCRWCLRWCPCSLPVPSDLANELTTSPSASPPAASPSDCRRRQLHPLYTRIAPKPPCRRRDPEGPFGRGSRLQSSHVSQGRLCQLHLLVRVPKLLRRGSDATRQGVVPYDSTELVQVMLTEKDFGQAPERQLPRPREPSSDRPAPAPPPLQPSAPQLLQPRHLGVLPPPPFKLPPPPPPHQSQRSVTWPQKESDVTLQ